MAKMLAIMLALAGMASASVTPQTKPEESSTLAAGLRNQAAFLPLERTILSYNPVAYWPLTQNVPDNYGEL